VHLGYGKHDPAGRKTGNSRNGATPKTLKGEFGSMELATPRARNGTFEPQIVTKGQRRFEGFDQAIISLYSRGLTTREIEGHLLEIYGVEVSPSLVSQVTDAVCAEVQVWQNRPLEDVYPIVYFDALWGKVRENGTVSKVAVYLALGITMAGKKEVLVHMVRHSLSYVGWKERKAVAADLRVIYPAATVTQAEQALVAFEAKWDRKYPTISKSWRAHWAELVMFLKYPEEIRRAIYTTNAIESVNRSLRKISKNRGVFPHQESLLKLYWLALERIAKKWTMPIANWSEALNRFAIEFGERMPKLD